MVGGRAIAVSFLLVGLGLSLASNPAAACHRTGDLCLPCEDGGAGACDELGVLHDVRVLGAVQDRLEPSEESMHFAGPDADRGAYVVIALEWDTPNRTAPPGHADVPFHFEFSSDDGVTWDGSPEMDLTFTTSETGRVTNYFAFSAPNHEVEIEYRIVANPGANDEMALEDEMTLEEDKVHSLHVGEVVRQHWLWLLVALAIGIAIGFAIANMLKQDQHRTPPP